MNSFTRWAAESGLGLEHLVIRQELNGMVAEGLVIGDRFGSGYAAHYRIEIAHDWSTRNVSVELADGPTLSLSADGAGAWRDADGKPLPLLDGCIDVDISATPFSNSLPIRRLALNEGERRQIRVVYLEILGLTVDPVDQAYTCLELGRRYRYEGLFRKFESELCVDEHGLVEDYPSLFRRVRSSAVLRREPKA